jgi:hypothetical protein
MTVGVGFQLNSLGWGVAVAEAQRQFANPEEGERPPLEAVTKGLEDIQLYLRVVSVQ